MAYAFLDQYYIDGSNADLAKLIEGTITSYVIPEGTTRIRGYAFIYCLSMKKITIPEGVAVISGNGLATTGLTELDLPMSCETLDAWSLYNNQYLTRIRLGNVKSIGASALRGAPACMEYDFTRCSTVPTLSNTDALGDINANAKIFVPAKLYYDWIAATNWAEYADHILPAGIVPSILTPDGASEGLLIENGVVNGRGSCTDSVIVVPKEVTSIAWGFLENDKTVDTLILPEKGILIDGGIANGSSLRVIKNYYYMYSSFGLYSADKLEMISVIGSEPIDNYQFTGLPEGIKYDFSRCESVPVLGSLDFITVGKGTLIYVPLKLYDEWIEATNWSEIAEYIVVAR